MIEKNRSEIQSRSFRDILQFYLIDCTTFPGKLIDIAIMVVNLFAVALFVIGTYRLSPAAANMVSSLQGAVGILFTIEYLARLYGARRRFRHIVSFYSIVDLVSILPTYLNLFSGGRIDVAFLLMFRVLLVFRIFRFLRFAATPDFFFGTVPIHVLRVIRLLLTIFIIFFVSSGLFWIAESPMNGKIANFGDAFYYTVVALTTVGFGDIVPVTEAGRWVSVLMIISGIILIPWQAGQVIRTWIHMSQKKHVVCPHCGLMYHDPDATHCKACGHVIYQEHEGG